MYYILTTIRANWASVKSESYSLNWISPPPIEKQINNTPTIFIKLNRDKTTVEKAWVGKINNIRSNVKNIEYDVFIDKELPIEPEFYRSKIGWFIVEGSIPDFSVKPLPETFNLIPLNGNWDYGLALNLHTLFSIPTEYGTFETTRTHFGELLYQIKYCNNREVIQDFKSLFKELCPTLHPYNIDVIIPVPPSKNRTYQPVIELSKVLSEMCGIPVDLTYLKKIKITDELKKIDVFDDRMKILDNAFSIEDASKYRAKTILLFDDLYRSGATLIKITEILKLKGIVSKVIVLTITKTRTKQ